jgi:hypothetical protein
LSSDDAATSSNWQEILMRKALFAFIATAGLTTVALTAMGPTPAQAFEFPYCLRNSSNGDECRFPSFEACQATVSGRGLTCFRNPAYAYAQPYPGEPLPPRHRPRHRRAY